PLADILGRDQELKDAAAILREALDALADAQTGAERVSRIVRDLRTFARAPPDEKHPIELAPVVERAIRLAENHWQERARLEIELGPAPRVLANEARLGQAFLQLIVNAAQAIPAGDVSGNLVRIVTKTDPEGRAVVEVYDSGEGI